MTDEKQGLSKIDWPSCFDFVRVFGASKMALDPAMLLLGLVGVVTTAAAAMLIGLISTCVAWSESLGVCESVCLLILVGLIAAAGMLLIRETQHQKAGVAVVGAAGIVALFTVLAWAGEPDDKPSVDGWVTAQLAGESPARASGGPIVFQAFIDFTVDRCHMLAESLWSFRNPLAGFGDLPAGTKAGGALTARRGPPVMPAARLRALEKRPAGLGASSGSGGVPSAGNQTAQAGALYHTCALVLGVVWVGIYDPFFTIVFGLAFLALWAILGGAMARIAALKATRQERIATSEALAFAQEKIVAFICAPLMPFLCIAMIAVILAGGGLVSMLPVLGDLIAAVLFLLAVLAGFVMALLAIGGVVGSFLMYPTIAVESSDAFDATSRSFAYVYQRPWRTGLYAFVAGVYGTICYMFLRTVVWLALKLTHAALSIGSFHVGGRTGADGRPADMVNALWPAPTFNKLLPDLNVMFSHTRHIEGLTALFMYAVLFLVVGTLAAYAVSYFLSASTVIYLLLRYHTDATDLEEVTADEDLEEEMEYVGPDEAETSGEGDDADDGFQEPAASAPAATPAAPPERDPCAETQTNLPPVI